VLMPPDSSIYIRFRQNKMRLTHNTVKTLKTEDIVVVDTYWAICKC
jgi:hypothetical protein